MSVSPFSLRTLPLLALLTLALTACAGDGGPSAPRAGVSLHLVEGDGAITEANTFPLRLRGSVPDSVTAVRVGGADAIAGLSDSTLLVLMPLGPAGAVTLEATAWVGTRSVPATLALTRVAGPSVGDPVAATTTLLADLDAEIGAVQAITPVDGVDPATLDAERADIVALRDSLEAQLGRLDPTSRSIALSIIKQIRDSESDALRASAETATCSSHNDRVACMRDARLELTKKLVRAAITLSYIGGGAFAIVALAGFTVTTALASAAVAGIVAAVLSFAAIDAKAALSDFVNSTYERAVDEVVRFEGRITESSEARVVTDAFTASAVAPITMLPDEPRSLPIERLTRSTIVGDTFPAVRGIADSVNLLAERWGQISARLPRPLQIPARTIGATPARVRAEPADFDEVSLVSIREGGAATPVTGTLTDAQPGIALTLSGDAGAGRDLTVRLALDGDGAGRVEFDVPIRYVAAPDTLDAIRALFEGQIWGWDGATFIQPWTVSVFQPGNRVGFNYCYGDPTVRVRCFGYDFFKNPDGSLSLRSTGSNGYQQTWPYFTLSASTLFMTYDPNDPNATSTTITKR